MSKLNIIFLLFLTFLGVLSAQKSDECTLCQDFVQIIQNNSVIANKTEHELINFVLLVCDKIGGTIVEQECQIYTNVLDSIFQTILHDLNPPDICYKLGFCT